MSKLLLIIIVLCLEALPTLFVFGLIGRRIYQNIKQDEDLSKLEIVFSWFIFGIYAICFMSIIPCFVLGYKVLGTIAFCSVGGIIVALLLGVFISKLIKKHQYKHTPKYRTTGNIVAAKMQSSTEVRRTGKEPVHTTYYTLKIKYTDKDGETKYAQSLRCYTLSEIACLNSFRKISIEVAGDYCTIDADVKIAPSEYNQESIENIEIVNDKKIKIIDTNKMTKTDFIIEKLAVLIFAVPVLIGMIFAGIVAFKESATIASIIWSVMGVLFVLAIVHVCRVCNTAIKTLNNGTEGYALEFEPIGITNSLNTYYEVKYSYKLESGKIKTKIERVLPSTYEAITHHSKLPIKIYGNKANIDIDKI